MLIACRLNGTVIAYSIRSNANMRKIIECWKKRNGTRYQSVLPVPQKGSRIKVPGAAWPATAATCDTTGSMVVVPWV
jgi:membrane protein implicated in regulation of membrane protease activity